MLNHCLGGWGVLCAIPRHFLWLTLAAVKCTIAGTGCDVMYEGTQVTDIRRFAADKSGEITGLELGTSYDCYVIAVNKALYMPGVCSAPLRITTQ